MKMRKKYEKKIAHMKAEMDDLRQVCSVWNMFTGCGRMLFTSNAWDLCV